VVQFPDHRSEFVRHIPQPVRRALVGCRGFKPLVQELEQGPQPRGGHLEAVGDLRSRADLGFAQEASTLLTGRRQRHFSGAVQRRGRGGESYSKAAVQMK
jgi:hypothetical protein